MLYLQLDFSKKSSKKSFSKRIFKVKQKLVEIDHYFSNFGFKCKASFSIFFWKNMDHFLDISLVKIWRNG